MSTIRHGSKGSLGVDLFWFVLIVITLESWACGSLRCPDLPAAPSVPAVKIAFASGGPAPVVAFLSFHDSGDVSFDGFAAKKFCTRDTEGVEKLLAHFRNSDILPAIIEGMDGRFFTINDAASVTFVVDGRSAEFTYDAVPQEVRVFLQEVDKYLRDLFGSRYDVPLSFYLQEESFIRTEVR